MKAFILALPLLLVLLPLLALAAEKPAPRADVESVVRGDSRFALELYTRLRTNDGNLFLSPFSISAALAMTSAGARGQTLDQMASTLHFPAQDRLHPAMAALVRQVNGAGMPRGYQLNTANALWGQKGYPFEPAFLRLLHTDYEAGFHETDFQADPERARRTINAWVEKQTHDRIKDLLRPDIIRRDTCLVLTNAIYFKGDWARPFHKDHTYPAPFTLADGQRVEVPLMSQKGRFRYLDGGTFDALEMPYQGNDLAMTVLLPKKADGLPALESALTAEKLASWLGRMREREVSVLLPRFRATSTFDLADVLARLGMPLAFSGQADFSGIARQERLALSAVVHKAFVEVNEQGTEAAAATAVVVTRAAARVVPVFRADHPFVFLIRDTRSGSLLFLGRLSNPG